MAPRKTERQLNLVICLLAAKRFLPRETIRGLVEGYEGLADAAFQRMFERDKDELRELGIPIETGSNDSFFEDEAGYRILPGDFALPPVELTPDEQVVLGIAAHVFDGAALAPQAAAAVDKLRAAGVEPVGPGYLDLRLEADEQARAVMGAVADRRRLRFDYRVSGATRRLEPWGTIVRRGSWYVYGLDRDRHAPRMFRLSRVAGAVVVEDPAGSYELPAPDVVEAAARSLEPHVSTEVARVAVRGRAAPGLWRHGALVSEEPDGWAVYDVAYSTVASLVDQVVAAAPDVVALSPAEARSASLARLAAVASRPLSTERP